MGDDFRLSHASATTEKAVEAAARVEAIVGAVINGNKRAWAKIDMEDVALLVQLARDAAAAPDWLQQIALRDLLMRAETAEARAAKTEVDVAEADVRCDDLARLLSEGLEIVESLSAGHDVWAAQVRRALGV